MHSALRQVVLLIGWLAALASADHAGGATYYVRMSGNDANAGTSPAAAWRKISKAASTMLAGDTAYVGAGTYSDNVTAQHDGTSTAGIRIIADTDGFHTGDPGVVESIKLFDVNGRDYWTIIGFRIRNTGNCGSHWKDCVGGLLQDCELYGNQQGVKIEGLASVTIDNCYIHNNSNEGIRVASNTGTAVVVTRCRVDANSNEGIYFNKADVTIKNCLITNGVQQGIFVDSDSNNRLTAWNCTIVNNLDGVYQKGGTATVTNCIVAFNRDKGFERTGGTLTHTYNVAYGNTTANYLGTTAGTGEVAADPQLADRSGGDYRLVVTSPAFNTGTSAQGVVDNDLDGFSRPVAKRWDMGCYELQYGQGGLVFHLRVLQWLENR